jgi:RNA polymerase sigma-70 factor (ECF subfamily)
MTELDVRASVGAPSAPRLSGAPERRLEQHRGELTGYCYRMLGSTFEAEDAVQETMVRAWRGLDRFEGRAALRSWLYRIATNVCLDMLSGRERRARPMDLGPASTADGPLGGQLPEVTWLEPIPDARVVTSEAASDPAALAESRETIRLAFVAALQHLPARQRAVLILREVLHWKASEVAELLDTTVVSVNSALQRARSTLTERNVTVHDTPEPIDEAQQELLARYVDAFERFDIESLIALLHEDVTMQMPPYPLWMRGAGEYRTWLLGPGRECEGSRLAPVEVNGAPGFAQWRRDADGGFTAWAIHVLGISDGVITAMDFFVDPELFSLFDLPIHLDA